MHAFTRMMLVAAPLLLAAPALSAQTDVDASGHWQGTVQAPDSPVSLEVDLARNAVGRLEGTMTIPSQQIKGLPLLTIEVTGTAINFQARSDQSFAGTVSADGIMSGQFTVGGASIPFHLVRAGEARIEAAVKSAAIPKALEGTWNGTLPAGATTLRLVLTMSNQPDGTATGRIVNVDQGGLQVPVSIGQDGPSVTIDSRVIGGSFSGVLSAAGTELVGTYKQGALSAPLTFTHQP